MGTRVQQVHRHEHANTTPLSALHLAGNLPPSDTFLDSVEEYSLFNQKFVLEVWIFFVLMVRKGSEWDVKLGTQFSIPTN